MALPNFVANSLVGRLAFVATTVYIIYFTISSLALWRKRSAIKRQNKCKPAPRLPQKDPFFGLDFFKDNRKAMEEGRMLDAAIKRFQDMKANTFALKMAGMNVVTTIDPENIKTILALDFKKYSIGAARKDGLQPMLGAGIFTTEGHEWQHSRDMLRPNFVNATVGNFEILERHVSNLVKAIPRDGSTIDLSDLFFRLTIDYSTEILFGTSTGSLAKGGDEAFTISFNRAQKYMANICRWGKLARLFPVNQDFEKDKNFVHDFVDGFVDKGLSKRGQLLSEKSANEVSGRYLFIDELVRQTDDRLRIRSELLNVLLAGRDSTASLMTNMWFILSKRKDVFQKLQEEFNELGGQLGREISFEQLKQCKYLKAVLNETLRLYPIVPSNSRQALEDTVIPYGGGPDGQSPVFISKGTMVSWNPYAMHRRKDFFGEDALEFKPERWIDDPATGRKSLRPVWEYLPFNGGPRICLGQQLALTEASYATLRICQEFSDIESKSSDSWWREKIALTCMNRSGAPVSLTPRHKK